MKKVLIFFGLLGIGVAVFVYVVQQTGFSNIVALLAQVTILQLLLFFAVSIVNFSLFTFRWWLILRSHGHYISFLMLLFYRMVGFSVSYLTPVAQSGGEPFRIYFLNERHKISLKESASSVVIDKVFEVSALLFFIGCGIAYVIFKGFFPPKMEIFLVVFLVAAVCMMFMFYKRALDGTGFFSVIFRFLRLSKIKRIAHLEDKIVHTEHFISRFFKDSSCITVPICIIISIVTVSVSILEHYLLTRFLGLNLNFSTVFLISTLPSIAYVIPVPGGFGILEGGHSTVFSLLALSPVVAIALVMLIRVRDLLIVFFGLLFASHHGLWLLIKSDAAKEIRKMLK
jgi:uncharacterized protein (TIRG00374 family)